MIGCKCSLLLRLQHEILQIEFRKGVFVVGVVEEHVGFLLSLLDLALDAIDLLAAFLLL